MENSNLVMKKICNKCCIENRKICGKHKYDNYKYKNLVDYTDENILNEIYNIVDCTINIANNEGFGLTTAESLMSGTPIIVNAIIQDANPAPLL